jgi:hypothetical protein
MVGFVPKFRLYTTKNRDRIMVPAPPKVKSQLSECLKPSGNLGLDGKYAWFACRWHENLFSLFASVKTRCSFPQRKDTYPIIRERLPQDMANSGMWERWINFSPPPSLLPVFNESGARKSRGGFSGEFAIKMPGKRQAKESPMGVPKGAF